MAAFGFEKLESWQLAVDFSNDVYQATRSFPADERFGLTSQARRSAVSVAANVAEGSSRSSRKDFARFVEIAYGSLMETMTHLAIAHQQGFLSRDDYDRLREQADRLARILSGLRNSLLRSY
jgi:four helix bundle protein